MVQGEGGGWTEPLPGVYSNWPSLNLTQNVREQLTHSYWEKTQKNLAPPPPQPSLYVRGLKVYKRKLGIKLVINSTTGTHEEQFHVG